MGKISAQQLNGFDVGRPGWTSDADPTILESIKPLVSKREWGGVVPFHYRAVVLLTVIVALAGREALAHHSVAGEFFIDKTINLNGVVSDVEWANPHIYIHFDVKDAAGTVTTWRLESVPVAMMRKAGLSKELLLGNGQTANVDAYLARDGTPHLGYLVKITYADGHHFQFASDK